MDFQSRSTNVHLHFERTTRGVIGYVDSDFIGVLDKIRSFTGYFFLLEVVLSTKKLLTSQITIAALSTIETGYIVITKTCKEAIWLKGIFDELGEDLQITMVFCDSLSTIFLLKDQMFHEKSKNIDM